MVKYLGTLFFMAASPKLISAYSGAAGVFSLKIMHAYPIYIPIDFITIEGMLLFGIDDMHKHIQICMYTKTCTCIYTHIHEYIFTLTYMFQVHMH